LAGWPVGLRGEARRRSERRGGEGGWMDVEGVRGKVEG